MPLKSTINNTNTQKENIKTVANNIDNKLVELGGEQAVNLVDVPNKIRLLGKNYKKQAIFKNLDIRLDDSKQRIIFPNTLKFSPKQILVNIQFIENGSYPDYVDNRRQIVVVDSKKQSNLLPSFNNSGFTLDGNLIGRYNQNGGNKRIVQITALT